MQLRLQAQNPERAQRMRTMRVVVGIVLLLILPFVLGTYLTEVLDIVGLFILMGLGLNIVVGYAGLLDLDQPVSDFLPDFAGPRYIGPVEDPLTKEATPPPQRSKNTRKPSRLLARRSRAGPKRPHREPTIVISSTTTREACHVGVP